MKYADYERDPCQCPTCCQAGVTELRQIRDWRTGEWIHGYALKRVYAAKDQFWKDMQEKLVNGKAMR